MTSSQVLVSTDQTGVELPADAPRYSLLVAHDNEEVLAAQKLRHQVFADEMGARLNSATPGLDVDRFDEYCDHLVVRDDSTGGIVGCYRMLPPDRAARAGSLYSDSEFELSALGRLRGSLVETGRSCVHPDHRGGAVMSLMWAGIARYMLLSGHRYLAGCASVPLSDGGTYAAGVWDVLRARHYSGEDRRVTPLRPWDSDGIVRPDRATLPPLIKGYVRLGAKVHGPPAFDADFGVADFFVMLDLHQVDERYLKYFLGARR
jgi:putative hemolysin